MSSERGPQRGSDRREHAGSAAASRGGVIRDLVRSPLYWLLVATPLLLVAHKLKPDAQKFSWEEVWQSQGAKSVLRNEWQTSILLGDHLFTRAFHLAATVDARACRLIGEATNRVCEGELR